MDSSLIENNILISQYPWSSSLYIGWPWSCHLTHYKKPTTAPPRSTINNTIATHRSTTTAPPWSATSNRDLHQTMRPTEAWFKGSERKKEREERSKRDKEGRDPWRRDHLPCRGTTRPMPYDLRYTNAWASIHIERGEREGGIEWERKNQRKWYQWEREREQSSMRERWVEREKSEKLNKMWKVGIKYNYFGLCYKTILHLDGIVVQLQIFLQFQDFARPDDELFLCLDVKIYQHMTYRRPNANPLTTQIGMVKTILYI